MKADCIQGLKKILNANTLADAKQIAADTLGVEPDDFIEDEDYIDGDIEELDFDN